MKSQKECIRRREKIWKKCRLESNWKAVKIEQRKYGDMVREAKIETVSNLVLECGRDTKKLYKVINAITCNNLANPMPNTMDDK